MAAIIMSTMNLLPVAGVGVLRVVRVSGLHAGHDEQHDEAECPADNHERPTSVAHDRHAVGDHAVEELERPRQVEENGG